MEAEFVLNNQRAHRDRKESQQIIRGLNSGEQGADTSFDPEYKRNLLIILYGKLP